jgi:hypothetical protein
VLHVELILERVLAVLPLLKLGVYEVVHGLEALVGVLHSFFTLSWL